MLASMVISPHVVLGVDLASTRWIDVGTALLNISPAAERCGVLAHPIQWPDHVALTEVSLAEAIDRFARANGVAIVSIDGPQAWRDPAASAAQGVGRLCEQSARTPGKTGPLGQTYPSNQVGWISFSIALFELLTSLDHVRLVDDPRLVALKPLELGEYYVIECFPTVTWRSAGLRPLPGKQKRPNTSDFVRSLVSRWPLASLDQPIGHDDLQAVVAALPAAAFLGFGQPIAHGTSSAIVPGRGEIPSHRVEGIIWDAAPPTNVPHVASSCQVTVTASERPFAERVERAAAALIPFVQEWRLQLSPEHLDEIAAAVLLHHDSTESCEEIEDAVRRQLAEFRRRREPIERSYREQLRQSDDVDV